MSEACSADGGVPVWQVLTATVRGAAHELAGLPLQDAAGYAGDPARSDGVLAMAVADGHGSQRHFRSSLGSELAIKVAGTVAGELGPRLAAAGTTGGVCAAVRAELVPAITDRWRRAVQDDVSERPLASDETRLTRPGDDITVPYGTTLLLAVVAFPWLALCQIGDGDIVAVDAEGVANLPVPGDLRLDGQHTTSLCQPDAPDAFRVAAVDLTRHPVAALLLATDGFGNAQTADPWHPAVGADLARFAREHGIAWMRGQLPVWVARCASAEGSGDDTAVVLLLRQDLVESAVVPAPPPAGPVAWRSTETWPPITRPEDVARGPSAMPATQREPPS